MKDLIAFGESRSTLLFLLDQVKKPKNIQSLKNTLELLNGFSNAFNEGENTVGVLSSCIFDRKYDEYVINRAILALANFKLQTKELTNKLVKNFKNNEKSYIRYGTYVYLHMSEYLDENIDFFIDVLKYHFENTNNEDSRKVMNILN